VIAGAWMDLTPEKALIFRITHISNVPWILDHGLHSASSEVKDLNFRPIGDPDLIAKRSGHVVPAAPGGTISDYVSFYFTPCSPMLYNIKTGHRGIERVPMRDMAVIVSSLPALVECGVQYLFTDCHAYLAEAQFFSDLAELRRIDWKILRDRDFAYSEEDPGKMQRYQAEALAFRHVPVHALLGIACYSRAECGTMGEEIERRGLDLKVVARPGWFF